MARHVCSVDEINEFYKLAIGSQPPVAAVF